MNDLFVIPLNADKEIKYFLSLDYSWKRKKYERGDCNEEKNNSME